MANEATEPQAEGLHPNQILAATPRNEWHVKIQNESLHKLLSDDPAIRIESLSETERSSVDVLVVGRGHGKESEAGVVEVAVKYMPNLIIHELSFSSQREKEMSDVFNTAEFWQSQVVVNIPGKLPVDTILLDPEENGQIETEVRPLFAPLRQKGAGVVVRAMGETDLALRSKGGVELQALAGGAVAPADDLIEAEAVKIIARESIMAEDISRIIGNLRSRYSLDTVPRLRVLVMGGAFHSPYIHGQLKALGVQTSVAFVFDKLYAFSAVYQGLLPADRKLYDTVVRLRTS